MFEVASNKLSLLSCREFSDDRALTYFASKRCQYSLTSRFTIGAINVIPTKFASAMANTIESENSNTASNLIAQPIITNTQKTKL